MLNAQCEKIEEVQLGASHEFYEAKSLCEIFREFGASLISEPISDFSRLHESSAHFCEVRPTSTEALSQIVRVAANHGIPIRTRGNGHTLNGSSLPQSHELMVRTLSLSHISDPSEGSVSVGAGCVIRDLQAWLRTRGYALPVLNAGRAGPTVGGYAAAGGFGPGSANAGGFWDNVSELTAVDGEGRVRVIARTDPLFPWLFGAMGQLGIITAAKLDIASESNSNSDSGADSVTHRRKYRAPQYESAFVQEPPAMLASSRDEAGKLFWFSLFVPASSVSEASMLLDDLERRHPNLFQLRDRYTYLIRHRNVVAPLIWPSPTSCYAVGTWGLLNDASPSRIDDVLAFDAEFMSIAIAKRYRRYVQSEAPSGPGFYRQYFGKTIYANFQARKAEVDPRQLLNRGWVFSYPHTYPHTYPPDRAENSIGAKNAENG